MKLRPRSALLVGFSVAALVIGAALWLRPTRRAPRPHTEGSPFAAGSAEPAAPSSSESLSSGRPRLPPGPGPKSRPSPPPEPVLPRLDEAERAKLAERVRRDPHPGMAAFRALSDRYVDENAAMAAEQAKKEGLTLGEVRELTHFGLLAMATQRVEDVEDIVGHPIRDEARGELSKLLAASDQQFESAMRELVKRGAGEDERWKLIRGMEERYLRELYRITGLDEETLDDLLAGNVGLPGAPAAGLPAAGKGSGDEQGPRDPVTPPAKPPVP